METFIARYEVNGVRKSTSFAKSKFDEAKASEYLKGEGIQNFMFFWEPYPPVNINEDTVLLRGDVGFDITTEDLIPLLAAGKNILLDSMGGSLWEGLKMYDAVKMLKPTSKIGVLGSAASAATPVILAFPPAQRGMSYNSRFLIHNPWTYEAGDDVKLRKTADDLQKEKTNLANLYAKETGATVENMLSLMSEEKFLNFEETKAFNFIINENSTNKNDEDMDTKETKAKLGALDKTFNALASIFGGAPAGPKNLVVQDANGVELDFGEDVDSPDQIVEGLTGVTAAGVPAEGDFTMASGEVYTFTAGTLDKIEPAEGGDDDMETIKQENADLKQQLSDAQNSVTAMTAERDAMQAKVTEANTAATAAIAEFKAFKSAFSEDTPPVNTPPAGGQTTKRR